MIIRIKIYNEEKLWKYLNNNTVFKSWLAFLTSAKCNKNIKRLIERRK
jgi:hypothetical protein